MEEIRISTEEFIEYLVNLPEGVCLRIDNDGGCEENHKVTKETFAEVHDLGKNLVMFHLIALTNRIGAEKYLAEIEHTYFPPTTPANEQFTMRWIKWNELLWTITTVPMESSLCFFDVAPKYNFSINPGSPLMLGAGVDMTYQSKIDGVTMSGFPLAGVTVYTIEGGEGIV